MSETFTKGPWRVDMSEREIYTDQIVAEDGRTIAKVYRLANPAAVSANAALISTAPTMYEILRLIEDHWADHEFWELQEDKVRSTIRMLLVLARDAR